MAQLQAKFIARSRPRARVAQVDLAPGSSPSAPAMRHLEPTLVRRLRRDATARLRFAHEVVTPPSSGRWSNFRSDERSDGFAPDGPDYRQAGSRLLDHRQYRSDQHSA